MVDTTRIDPSPGAPDSAPEGAAGEAPEPSTTPGGASDGIESAPSQATSTRWITRRRLAKWNRPRPPRDWRWAVTHVGRTLIAAGILMFGFVAYQLWGTNLETARAQRALAEEFDELLAASPQPSTPDPTGDGGGDADDGDTTTDEPADATAPDDGDRDDDTTDDGSSGGSSGGDDEVPEVVILRGAPLARISMPTLGVEEIVVSGIRPNDLQKGPGHFPSTALPGHLGNSAIAGHRTTYGSPFRDVDRLAPGDEIIVTTVQGTFTYRVTGTEIVEPSDGHVVSTTDPDVARLTLVSCHPVLSAAQRIIIYADLDLSVSSPIVSPTTDDGDLASGIGADEDEIAPPGTSTGADDQAQTAPEPVEPREPGVLGDSDRSASGDRVVGLPLGAADFGDEAEDAFARGWFHDEDAYGQIALWGALLALVSIGAYLLSRVTRRDLVGFTVGIAPFAFVAFFFFQNVNRLLPPGL